MSKRAPTTLLLTALLLAPATAFAQPPTNSMADDSVAEDEGSYGYIFKDDDLLAEGLDASSSLIRVRPVGARQRLLRPRVEFVSAMLKSVETL